MKKRKPVYPCARKRQACRPLGIDDFIKAYSRRIFDSTVVCEVAGPNPTDAYGLVRKSGYRLLSHRECPGFLDAGQLLLWPANEPIPEAKKNNQRAPAYNPSDGRRFIPSQMLDATELENALFEGDCLEILPFFPDHCIDLILCDLPYGTTQNKWDSVIPLDILWQQYKRVIKPGGVIVLTSHGIFTAKLMLSNERWFKYKIVWEKSKPTNFLNAKKQPLRKHEDVCVFYERQPVYNPIMGNGMPYDKGVRKDQLSGSYGDFLPARVRSGGQRYPTDVVYFKTAESEGTVWHPTQKPVELGRYLVRTYTDPGALVLDNAFGSGSFLVAAAMEGRRYVGIEQNQDVHLFKSVQIDYVGVARSRLLEIEVSESL